MNPPITNDPKLRDEIFAAGKALFIGAHPDDIEFYCGGLIHMLRQAGTEATFAIATRGGKGLSGRRRERLEGLRTECQMDAAKVLGGANVIFYDYPDKELAAHVEPFAREIEGLIAVEQPDIIFSWDPDFIYNPHPDHQAAANASKIATKTRRVFYYGTREPDLWIGFGDDVFQVKIKSLRAHRTETPWYYWMLIRRRYIRRMMHRCCNVGARYAEVFRAGA
ncbi:MAG: PIG-L family deacetylase [Armatimonadetes bacterium]|nr:PIG-L family deacetylase [Armatimonadota bacterium]